MPPPAPQDGELVGHCGHLESGGRLEIGYLMDGFRLPGHPDMEPLHWLGTCSLCVLQAGGNWRKFQVAGAFVYDREKMSREPRS